jgi:hypothetical protein
MTLSYHIKIGLLNTIKVVMTVFCLIVSFTELSYAAGPLDETPYNPPVSTGAPQPFNAINNSGASLQRPIRPRTPNDVSNSTTERPNANSPRLAPTPAAPPVVVPPTPQVVTGTGRNFGNITLRVDPLMIRTKEGDIVQQDIIIDNPRGLAIDEAEIVLKYSAKNLDVLDSDPTQPGINIKPFITPQKNPGLQIVLNQVDTTKGQIHFIIKSLSSNSYIGGKLATISWKAKKASFYTPITFVFPADFKSPGTKVRRQGKDLLGADSGGSEGVITGGIAILPAPVVKTSGDPQ